MPTPATRPAWIAAAEQLSDAHGVTAGLHERHGVPTIGPGPKASERFAALAQSIAYQQLAGRAAATIWGRVVTAVGEPFTPVTVLFQPSPPLPKRVPPAWPSGLSAVPSAPLQIRPQGLE